MQLQLRLATVADFEACAVIATKAFASNSFLTRISSTSPESNQIFWDSVVLDGVEDEKAHVTIVEDTSSSPPVAVGLTKWVYVPAGVGIPRILAGRTDMGADIWSQTGDPDLARTFFADQDDRHEKYMEKREHWYLALICTDLAYQGSGAGKLLMRWGIEKIDADGCEGYLEASPAGKPVFEKRGFHAIDQQAYMGGAYVEYSMLREAEKSQGVGLEK